MLHLGLEADGIVMPRGIGPQGKYSHEVGKRPAVPLVIDNLQPYLLVGTDGISHLCDGVVALRGPIPVRLENVRGPLQKPAVSTHDLMRRVAGQLAEARGRVYDGCIRCTEVADCERHGAVERAEVETRGWSGCNAKLIVSHGPVRTRVERLVLLHKSEGKRENTTNKPKKPSHGGCRWRILTRMPITSTPLDE